jgi:hypothetical protein
VSAIERLGHLFARYDRERDAFLEYIRREHTIWDVPKGNSNALRESSSDELGEPHVGSEQS